MRKRTSVMPQSGRWCVLVSCLFAVAGCSSQPTAPLTPVMIQSLQDVDGRWEGMVWAIQGGNARRVTVILTNHDTFATYAFAGMSSESSFLGTGRLQLERGRLLTVGESRTLTFTLATRGAVRMLMVDGVGKDGKSYHAELSPAR